MGLQPQFLNNTIWMALGKSPNFLGPQVRLLYNERFGSNGL